MTKRTIYAFKLSKENSQIVDDYIAKFPEKSKSELLAALVMKALGVSKQTDSSINEDSPTPKGSGSPSSPFSEGGSSAKSLGETPQSKYDAHDCSHRAIDFEKNKWYCEGKLIPVVVCKRRQGRFTHTKLGCFPQHIAKHCKVCGREIRPQYKFCFNCMEDRKERKEDRYYQGATKRYMGD